MRIVKHGVKYPEWYGRCENCSCEFICEDNEVKKDYDRYRPTYATCPECGESVEVDKN